MSTKHETINNTNDVIFRKKFKLKFKKKHLLNILLSVLRLIFVLGICYVILYPLIIRLSMTFKSEIDMFDPTVALIPKNFTLHNYITVVKEIRYWKSLYTTIGYIGLISLITTFMCTVVGYGLARFNFKLKNLIFIMVMITMIIPPQSLAMSNYLNFRYFNPFGIISLLGMPRINLTGNGISMILLALTCTGLKNGFFIFIMKQYFTSIPNELAESAYIDGAGPVRTLISIVFPLAASMMVTVFLFTIVWMWNDVYYTSLLTGDIPLLTKSFTGSIWQIFITVDSILPTFSNTKQMMLLSTTEILVILPLVIIYIIGQKYIVGGIERSGIVG